MWRLSVSRTQLNDVALTLAFVVMGSSLYFAGFASVGQTPIRSLPQWFPLVTLAVAAGFQLLRSRHPGIALAGVTVAVLVDTVTAASVPVWLVFSDIVYAACVYGSARLLRALFAVCVFVAAGTFTLVAAYPPTSTWRFLFLCVLWLIALVVSPLAYGLAVREHRNALKLERAHSHALAELAALERAEAVADERRRLARELHDVIAGRLSAIAVQSAAALQYPENAQLGHQALMSVRTSSVDALTEMRGLIDLLADDHDGSTRETAGLRRIDRLTDPISQSGTPIDLVCPEWIAASESVDALPAVVDIAAYRIVAESLANAVTHAPGQPVSVLIADGADAATTGDAERFLDIVVRNRMGPSIASSDIHTGRGIDNMITRARAVGGTVTAQRDADGSDFVVCARLPLAARPPQVGDPQPVHRQEGALQ